SNKHMAEEIVINRTFPPLYAQIDAPLGTDWKSHALVHLEGSSSNIPAGAMIRWVFLESDTFQGLSGLAAYTPDIDVEMPAADGGLIARLIIATPGYLPPNLYTTGLPCTVDSSGGQCDSTEIVLTNPCCPEGGSCAGNPTAPSVTITGLSHGEKYPFTEPVAVAAEATVDPTEIPVYRWWYMSPWTSGYQLLSDPGPDGTGFDAAEGSIAFNADALGLEPGIYQLKVEVGGLDPSDPEGCVNQIGSAQVMFYLTHDLSAVAPGQAFPGDTIRVYGKTFRPSEDLIVRIDDDPNYGLTPYNISATATSDHYVDVVLPPDMIDGTVYYVSVGTSSDYNSKSLWEPALEVVTSGYTDVGLDDPNCTGVGQEAASPIVPGQVVTGDFCDAGDTDYFYFPAAAGTTLDISLERIDETLSVYHPDSIDPEFFVINPDGIAPASGFANDNSADDTNASLTGFTTTQTGLYGIACRTSRATGQYRLTINRTGTTTVSNFSVVPYGDRAVAVVPQDGSTSSASLQALVFDPQGLPAAGATLTWQELEGTPATTEVYSSNTMGLGQGNFTLDTGASATLKPSFDWPEMPAKSYAEEEAPSSKQPASSGALLGVVHLSPNGIVTSSRLPGPAKAQAIVKVDREMQAKAQAGEEKHPHSKIMANCNDPAGDAQKISEIAFPANAVSIESFTIELTDDLGNALGEYLPGFTVAEHHDLGVRLIAHCKDDADQPFDATLTSAPIALASNQSHSDLAGGIVRFGGTCLSTVIPAAAGDWTPFTHEVGKRAILSHIDDLDEAHFVFTELLSASIALKAEAPAGGWTILRGSSEVEVQPEHGEPTEIRWLEPKDLREVVWSTWIPTVDDPPNPSSAFIVQGPQFYMLDAWGNNAALWGRNDSRWRRGADPNDEISLTNPGEWGIPPWVGIEGRSGTYQPTFFVDGFSGVASWQFCAHTSTGDICDTFSLDNTGNLNIVTLQSPWPQDCNYSGCNSGGYVSDAEAFDASSWRTSPGGPLLYHPSGKPVLIRAHPVNTDDLGQPHSQPFQDVPAKVWLNGPKSSRDDFHYEQENAGEPFELLQETDVELCTGVMTQDSNGVITATCDQLHQGEAVFTASTDELNPDGSGFLGNVVGVTKAPAEPGWYTLMVESDDARFNATGQRTYRAGWSFAVMGGVFLDANHEPVNQINAEQPTQVYLFLEDQTAAQVGGSVFITSYGLDESLISEDVEVTLTPAGGGSDAVGAMVLYPDGYEPAKHGQDGEKLTGLVGPRINAGVAVGQVKAFNHSQNLLANSIAAFPAELQLLFMKRDLPGGGGARQLTPNGGTEQETEIGPETENYAEKIWLRIQAVNPFKPSEPPLDVDWEVGIVEEPNQIFESKLTPFGVVTGRFFDGSFGSTELDDTSGLFGPLGNRRYFSLVHGVVDLPEPLVSTAVARWWLDLQDNLNLKIYQHIPFSGDAGAQLQAVPGPGVASLMIPPSPGDTLQLELWVDERTYNLRRNQSPPQGWSGGGNGTRDWVEMKVWDYLATQHLSPPDPEVEEALSLPQALSETAGPYAIASVIGSKKETGRHLTVNLNPLADGLRLPHPPQAGPQVQYFFGYKVTTDTAHPLFDDTMIHETRHAWQYNLSLSGSYIDSETPPNAENLPGDFLVVNPPASAAELADGDYGPAQGQNPDLHYHGDSVRDSINTMRSAIERDAARFTHYLTNDSLECVMNPLPEINGEQNQPVIGVVGTTSGLLAHATFTADGYGNSRDLAGIPIRWHLENGNCELTCDTLPCADPSPLVATEYNIVVDPETNIITSAISIIGVNAASPMTCVISATIEPPLNPTDCTPPLQGDKKQISIQFVN
ncbi:MAG: hypothetical protein DRJ65_15855, partial [Acidobacteria bacterium]